MKEKKVIISYTSIDTSDLVSSDWMPLFAAAEKALEDSYSPYSRFQVAAAALLENDEIITGANQENAAFPSCTCAEHIVLGSIASQYPHMPIERLAISTSSTRPLPAAPCGNCRQLLMEFEMRQSEPIRIAIKGRQETYIFDSVSSLLPFSFLKGHF